MAHNGEITVSFQIDEDSGYSVIRFSGEIDLYGSPHAREVILDCLEKDKHTLVDLSDVSYIDSSGVASLVEGYQVAKNKNLGFGLVNISESVMNVLQLAHLDKVFPIYPTPADAPDVG